MDWLNRILVWATIAILAVSLMGIRLEQKHATELDQELHDLYEISIDVQYETIEILKRANEVLAFWEAPPFEPDPEPSP